MDNKKVSARLLLAISAPLLYVDPRIFLSIKFKFKGEESVEDGVLVPDYTSGQSFSWQV